MRGAEAVLDTLANAGVEVCFSNPGTSEMHLVAEMTTRPAMRNLLCLFEGVATGAADGYGRMAEKPASVLLHLGPGLGNGLANLHNARRAATPVVNLVGDHATYLKALDPPLNSDIETIAAPVSAWVRRTTRAADAGRDTAEAIFAARSGADAGTGGVATLILPSDICWSDGANPAEVPVVRPTEFDPGEVERAAKVLRGSADCLLFVGGANMRPAGLRAAARIARATGARLLAEKSPARHLRDPGVPDIPRLPYPLDDALARLHGYRHIVFAGARPPVAFFAYPGKPTSLLPASCEVHQLGMAPAALEYLAELVAPAGGIPGPAPLGSAPTRPGLPSGELTVAKAAAVVGALLPEYAVVVDEAMTCSESLLAATAGGPQHDWLCLTGGSIGMGMPAATGAAVACPDRPVLTLQADGSAMYTPQALWTQAREGLHVVTVIFNNSSYAILASELARVRAVPAADLRRARGFIDISGLDFVALAAGMGVPATSAQTADEFADQLRRALAEPGPHLIEAVVPAAGLW
ncbi:acetolactate synthase-1/2/3 large subunit [Micromonospora viridifaciens]|uniref:Acetolactate synthase-1/2/3 large subunit n=1 Tax=Micromonospora viridifaciens TaxID=1881 RepID=A0A1C4X182_MICVI|nr:acetolactate synthase large subunit [Micromonospora viridifaciens]SCF02242.1 acetolactate synthase-1/2/3 large subunit [Micromonospora viridifaciens]